MSRYDDQVLDEFNRPVPGVSVYVYDDAGALDTLTDDLAAPLTNPLTTDADGRFYFNAADGEKLLDFRFGGRTRYKQEILVGPQPAGPVGPAGDVAKADTRAALAAVVGMAAKATRFLAEAGREGAFVWDPSNLSAQVTADPHQGIYVAPASDPTGASGAWVRKYSGRINAAWFGTTEAAIRAVQTYIAAVARAGYGYNVGVPAVDVPFAVVNFTSAFDITYPIKWIGQGDGGGSNAASVWLWNNTSSGLRIQYVDTTGDTGTQAPAAQSGSSAMFEGIQFNGGYTNGDEAERHAVHARAKATFRNCNFFNWAGDAIHIDADVAQPQKGNANLVYLEGNCFAQNCRDGWWARGGDSNAGSTLNFSAVVCRRWGFNEGSFLGNKHIAPHLDANARTAWNTGLANRPCSYVSRGGNQYFVIHGQEIWASANAPSGTTADNQGWGWWKAGGVDAATGVPAWFAGINIRSGGPILITGVNCSTEIIAPHLEDNGISQIDQYGMVLGNSFSSGVIVRVSAGLLHRNRAAHLASDLTGFVMGGGLRLSGDANFRSITNFFGPTTGTGDSTTYFDSMGTISELIGRVGGVEKGRVRFAAATDGLILNSGTKHRFDIAFAEKMGLTATALNLAAGVDLQVNAVKVVGARKTGWATATGTATRTTFDTATVTLPQLAERVKALIDDLHGTAGHGLIGA